MELDYKDLGLKCGLEIHQQLDTGKLFCSCQSSLVDEEPDFEITRNLRAVAGESGEIDVAALHEQKKQKVYIYQGHYQNSCLVELDEEPPHEMNPFALKIVLQACKMTNAKVVDQIQVMRKTVVDGSNTSGFQRTSLVGMDGHITVDAKKIRIPTICIEEDACRIIQNENDFTVYRLDRLGIPLIEISTHADIKTPQEAKDVAEYIGMLLRSTGKVKRGLGTIRQDVNVSIKQGSRVEIKGAQDLRQLKKIVELEALRQKTLAELKQKIKPAKHAPIITDLTKTFSETDCNILRNKAVFGIKLQGLAGFLGKEIQPGKRLGSELSDYAKTAGVQGLFHSDEALEGYGISKQEIDNAIKELEVEKSDAFVLIADKKDRAELALNKVIERVALLSDRLPEEVRRANQDGTSTYLRPMPGGSRMYPETDIPPIMPGNEEIETPLLLTEKKENYKKVFGLSDDLAGLIVKKNIPLENFTNQYPSIDPVFLAEYFTILPKEAKRRFNTEIDVHKSALELFPRLENNELPKEAVLEILVDMAKGKKINWDGFKIGEDTLAKQLKEIIDKYPNINLQALMGEAMKALKGRVPGKKVLEELKKLKDDKK